MKNNLKKGCVPFFPDIVGDCLAGLVRQSWLENPDYPFVCYPYGDRLDFLPDVFVGDKPFVPFFQKRYKVKN